MTGRVDNSTYPPLQSVEWCPGRERSDPLGAGVDVWRIDSRPEREYPGHLFDVLSSAERDRAARFHFEKDQWSYRVSHAFKRLVLSRYLGEPPASLAFENGEWGKPQLKREPGQETLSFNLSHSRGVTLVAVRESADVGVDVEGLQTRERMQPIFERFASKSEREEWEQLDESVSWTLFFTAWWVGKEAYIKAIGKGLSLPLDAFSLGLTQGADWSIKAVPPEYASSVDWQLTLFEVGPQHLGALASAPSSMRTFSADCLVR